MSEGKTCPDCGDTFPVSKDHFKVRKDGSWDTRCLACRARVNRGKRLKSRQRDMRAIETGAVNSFVKAAAAGGETIPHSSELLERLMEYFGGTSGFSALLVKQYFDSAPGGSTRTKMLESIVRLVTRNTEMGGAKKPLGQWTDDELETELDSRLRALAVQFQGRIVDGTVTQEASGAPALAVGQEGERVSSRPAERATGRARRKKDRSPPALPADSEASGDACLPGK